VSSLTGFPGCANVSLRKARLRSIPSERFCTRTIIRLSLDSGEAAREPEGGERRLIRRPAQQRLPGQEVVVLYLHEGRVVACAVQACCVDYCISIKQAADNIDGGTADSALYYDANAPEVRPDRQRRVMTFARGARGALSRRFPVQCLTQVLHSNCSAHTPALMTCERSSDIHARSEGKPIRIIEPTSASDVDAMHSSHDQA